MSGATSKKSERFHALDTLRGWFMLTVIVDHLNRWPSLFTFMSGQGLLWANAAEGFVMLSGFLVGYIRGHKGVVKPFKPIAMKLLSRGVLLYVWCVGMTMFYALLNWYIPIPDLPSPPANKEQWLEVFTHALTLQHAQAWVHFLYLYSIFLVLSVGVIWLLRAKKRVLLVTAIIATYVIGYTHDIPWMRWQVLFFVPTIFGYHFPAILRWWHSLVAQMRTFIIVSCYGVSVSLIIASVFDIFWGGMFTPEQSAQLFGFAFPLRILVATIWFLTIIHLFTRIHGFIDRYSLRVIPYIGTHSLTAYIAHGPLLCIAFLFTPHVNDAIYNTLLGIIVIITTYLIISLPLVKKLLPR